MGWQLPILTDGNHTSAQIINIKTKEILNFISNGGVAVIAGFQGISTNNRITTLGRGGSDLSAVAIAKFFETDCCEIYTDVEGVLTTDPSIHKKAKKIDKISYEEMLEMASLGAKVLQPISVQASMIDDIPVHVRSVFLPSEAAVCITMSMLMLFFPRGSKIAAATPGLSATPTRVTFASCFE